MLQGNVSATFTVAYGHTLIDTHTTAYSLTFGFAVAADHSLFGHTRIQEAIAASCRLQRIRLHLSVACYAHVQTALLISASLVLKYQASLRTGL